MPLIRSNRTNAIFNLTYIPLISSGEDITTFPVETCPAKAYSRTYLSSLSGPSHQNVVVVSIMHSSRQTDFLYPSRHPLKQWVQFQSMNNSSSSSSRIGSGCVAIEWNHVVNAFSRSSSSSGTEDWDMAHLWILMRNKALQTLNQLHRWGLSNHELYINHLLERFPFQDPGWR